MRRIYINGNIVTLDRRYTSAKVVVVDNGIITKVGDESVVDLGDNKEVINLEENTLIPGFVVGSSNIDNLNLSALGITTVIATDSEINHSDVDKYNFLAAENKYTEAYGHTIRLDGNLFDKRACLSSPYQVVPQGELLSYSGVGRYKYIEIKKFINWCYKSKRPIMAVTNGDEAVEQFLNAYEKIYVKGTSQNIRAILRGCEVVCEKQIARMRMLGIIPQFPIWTLFDYGDFYKDSVLGEGSEEKFLPLQTCCKNDLMFSFDIGNHTVLKCMQYAVQRRTSANFLMGKCQRITPLRALRSATLSGAYSIGMQKHIGSISVGKKADFVILDKNPCEVNMGDIGSIVVLETIKNGKTIYKN